MTLKDEYVADINRLLKAVKACAEVKTAMDKLTDDQRMEVMNHFCRNCGSQDPNCKCWNDE